MKRKEYLLFVKAGERRANQGSVSLATAPDLVWRASNANANARGIILVSRERRMQRIRGEMREKGRVGVGEVDGGARRRNHHMSAHASCGPHGMGYWEFGILHIGNSRRGEAGDFAFMH